MAFEVTDAINRNSELWQRLRAMPKIELHRHLEGAIRIETLVEIAKLHDIPLPSYDCDILRPYVQVTRDDPADHKHFLTKFSFLRQLFISEEVIRRVARETVEDAAADNIRYMELRFTPYAQAKLMNFALQDVVDWVTDTVAAAAQELGIKVNLIVAMNRHESVEIGREMYEVALAYRDRGVVGVDLCGNEVGYPADPFADIFLDAHREGLGVTIHAGEWQGHENVLYAINHMKTRRIGHGVRTVEDSKALWRAVNDNVYFEVCPTSNMQTGVVPSLNLHPLIDLSYSDAKITLNTDDPAIHNVSLTDEYALAVQGLDLPVSFLKRCLANAVDCAFLPEDERDNLRTMFKPAMQELDTLSRELRY
ncbi:MAG: adenosine deaminase [Chloroflexi bacterium]|nr:adenosine deaminase [Chloroflexota bacterium]